MMLKKIILAFVMTYIFVSCSDEKSPLVYDFTCTVANDIKCDSVELFVYEDDYTQLRFLAKSKLKNGEVKFTGKTERPRIAFVRLNNDTTVRFFILEPTQEKMLLSKHTIKLEGGLENKAYYKFLLKRENLKNERKLLAFAYKKSLRDSTLNLEREQSLHKKDSIANLQLQRLILTNINAKKIYSKIISQRFGHELDEKHYKLIKTDN